MLPSIAKPCCRLAGTILIIAFLWLIVLPTFGRLPLMKSYIRSMQASGVNPSALFYTEHPAGRDWEHALRIKSRRR